MEKKTGAYADTHTAGKEKSEVRYMGYMYQEPGKTVPVLIITSEGDVRLRGKLIAHDKQLGEIVEAQTRPPVAQVVQPLPWYKDTTYYTGFGLSFASIIFIVMVLRARR